MRIHIQLYGFPSSTSLLPGPLLPRRRHRAFFPTPAPASSPPSPTFVLAVTITA